MVWDQQTIEHARQRMAAEEHPKLPRKFIRKEVIERICDQALEKHGLMPAEPGPVRVEALLEAHWGISEAYENLPEGVLGAALFMEEGMKAVIISTQEFGEGGEDYVREARFRSTLAHEIGHGLLHEKLWQEYFREQNQPGLFDEAEAQRESEAHYSQMCRGETIMGEQPPFQWWEYQANLAMGHLLVPTRLLRVAIEPYNKSSKFCQGLEQVGLGVMARAMAPDAVFKLSREFKVSKALMRLRLKTVADIQDYWIDL